jgi:hypothetical protein
MIDAPYSAICVARSHSGPALPLLALMERQPVWRERRKTVMLRNRAGGHASPEIRSNA